ncbi:MAG TPA: hypothetical protein VLG67_01600 [Candidatus Saccharimonadales bacterium]|nr:hypothetical protein [Candidatus Saccharimonadales bacterium]
MVTTIFTIFLVIFLLLVVLIPVMLCMSFLFGPPYVPTPKKIIKEMMDLIDAGPHDVVIDLGSGDGAVLIEAALRGATAKGWEINPFLVLLTKIRARIKDLNNNIFVYTKPYQNADLADATVIFCYCLPKFIPQIIKKVKKEALKDVKIVSYKFPIPDLKMVTKTKSGIFIYSMSK